MNLAIIDLDEEVSKMRIRFLMIVLTIILVGFLFKPYHAQKLEKEESCPLNLSEWSVVARGKMSRDRGVRPLQIIRMDNNGEILFACIEAKTTEQINAAGIEFLQSQLELLIDWDLLQYDGAAKTYQTTIHVYGPEKIAGIRQQVRASVEELVKTLDVDLASLKSHLGQINREKNLFAVLYAYVLHGYAMNQFGEEIYRKPQLSAEHPFWNGFAWALYPEKIFDVGNIVLPVEGNQFYVVGTSSVKGPGFRQYIALVKDVMIDKQVDDPELKKAFSGCDVFDEQGVLTIPVFDSLWSAKLEEMAKKVYAETAALANSPDMKNLLGMAVPEQAAMFIHYEIRYAFLDYLLSKNMIPAPIDFENADKNSTKDIGNLVFLIRSQK